MADSNEIMKIVQPVLYDPQNIHRLQLQYSEAMYKGSMSINNENIPLVNILEMNGVTTALLARDTVAQTSLIYPSLCTTNEELFRHMAYIDYMGIWGSPGSTLMYIRLPYHEVEREARPTNDGNGTRKFTIPRHTAITVANTTFTFQYPIDIWFMPHGAVNVAFDITRRSPIELPLTSRIDGANIATINNIDYITIPVRVKQMAIQSQSTTLTGIAGFSKAYSYSDLFFFCRAFIRPGKIGDWQEIYTTHSDMTYDVTRPTAVLKVDPLTNTITATIPQIYISNGMIRDQVRFDIYTTKGSIDMSLENFSGTAFSAEYVDMDQTENVDPLGFSTRMGKISLVQFFATEAVTGGSDEMPFGERRNRVIHRSNVSEQLPITDLQLDNRFKDNGFNRVVVLDNIASRQFLATRRLPAPVNQSTISSMGSTVQLQSINLNQLAQLKTVIDNGNRLTVLPNTLYEIVNGIMTVVNADYVETLKDKTQTSPDALSNLVNNANYFYTPYFNVHDISGNTYTMRPYRLDNPKILTKYATVSNNTLGLTLSIQEYDIKIMPDYSGYRVLFKVKGSELLKTLPVDQLKLQLSYYDPDSTYREIFTGELISPIDAGTGQPIDDDWVYEVFIPTNWDVDVENRLNVGSGSTTVPLIADWDIVLVLVNHFPPGAITTTLEDMYDPSLFDDFMPSARYIGVIGENSTIKIGTFMDKLWRRTNSVVEEWMYKRYTEDIPSLYPDTLYDVDEHGNDIVKVSDDGTTLVRVVLHRQGEQVIGPDGKPAFIHYKGEVVKDEEGEPIILEGERGILRHFDMFLLDGKYYFANTDSIKSYVTSITDTIEGWVTGTLVALSEQLMNRSRIFFHPISAIGNIRAYVGDNQLVTLEADQKLKVVFKVPNFVYQDLELRRVIRDKTKQLIEDYFVNNKTMSKTSLTSLIKDAIGTDQLGFSLDGLFSDLYDTITIANDSVGPSIGKRLVTTSTLELIVEDNIDIDFVKHRVLENQRQA